MNLETVPNAVANYIALRELKFFSGLKESKLDSIVSWCPR